MRPDEIQQVSVEMVRLKAMPIIFYLKPHRKLSVGVAADGDRNGREAHEVGLQCVPYSSNQSKSHWHLRLTHVVST